MMSEILSAGWFPVVTLIAGYAMKSLSDWVNNKRAIAREREAREAVRKEQRFERRVIFQRETLLALQESAHKFLRNVGRAHHVDEMAYRRSNVWRSTLLPDDLDNAFREHQSRTLMLSVRVRDNDVREMATELINCAIAVVMTAQRDTAISALGRTAEIQKSLNTRIGELVREIDDTD
jgi:hypothetical protein